MTERPAARFITLEGGEGAGKSTHARALSQTLTDRGIDNIVLIIMGTYFRGPNWAWFWPADMPKEVQ